MKRVIGALIFACIAMCIVAMSMQSGDPAAEKDLRFNLIGTWRMVSMKVNGMDNPLPNNFMTYKHITPAGFMWLSHEKDTGKVFRAAGGTYVLAGNNYTERIEYGIGSDYEIIKSSQASFTANIDGDRWYHTGKLANGTTIEEVWERLIPGK